MSVEIQWNDLDPFSGEKRFVSVERFAGKWTFHVRFRRRENWQKVDHPTRVMWEELLDALERRLPRREGVTDVDLVYVREQLRRLPKPAVDAEVSPDDDQTQARSGESDNS